MNRRNFIAAACVLPFVPMAEGAAPGVVIKPPARLSLEQRKQIIESMKKLYRGVYPTPKWPS